MSSSDDLKLPRDLVEEILKRLPVESLLRFRCVCRSWRSIIDDPRFVANHLNHSVVDASKWYIVCLELCGPRRSLCSLFPNESLTVPAQSQIEIPFVAPLSHYDIAGSCNGLICFTEIPKDGNGQTMHLWNLFTRRHKAVRRSGPEHQFFCGTAQVFQGFCFDVRSNDYKTVRVLFCPAFHFRCRDGTKPRVEIYSLSTDSWRILECEVPALCDNAPPVFLNGKLHWPTSPDLWDKGGYLSIVLFDVADEVFDVMALPEEIYDIYINGLVISVAVLNDLLAVFISRWEAWGALGHRDLYSVCSVWVMKDYGMPESWTKLHTFESSGVVTGFDGFTQNGELLIYMDGGERVSWDLITGDFANLSLSTTCNLVTVVESLVSL